MMKKSGRIIILESCPGAGKTTLGQSLQYHRPSCIFIPEEVNLKKLEEYLADMQNKATEFQFESQRETMSRIRKAALLASQGNTVVLERGLGGNSCFAELQYETGLISEEDMKTYREQFTYDKIPELEGVEMQIFYMRASPEFCMTRIAKRARPGENTYSLDYIRRLKMKHDVLLGESVIVIDCERNTSFTSSGHLPINFVQELLVL